LNGKKILQISLKINFTPNTLGFYGLKIYSARERLSARRSLRRARADAGMALAWTAAAGRRDGAAAAARAAPRHAASGAVQCCHQFPRVWVDAATRTAVTV